MHPRPRSPEYRLATSLVTGPVRLWARRDWRGADLLPRDGGFVVAANHTSYADPLCLGVFLHDNGYSPRFMGKAELFAAPLTGRVLRGAGQIPVHRGTGLAGHAYREAVDAVRAGECVVVYPEGTLTKDPDLWPMAGRPGVARIALESGCPVVPIAMWGPERLIPAGRRRVHVLPRITVSVMAGEPVDLEGLRAVPITAPVLAAATERIMDQITTQLAALRGETPPVTRFDPRAVGAAAADTEPSATMRPARVDDERQDQ